MCDMINLMLVACRCYRCIDKGSCRNRGEGEGEGDRKVILRGARLPERV